MDVRLPDGTVITNVPEGTTQSDLLARVQKMRAPPEDPTSARNLVGAAVEPNANLLSGAVAAPVAGLAGILTPAANALGLTDKSPADVVRTIQGGLTYQPKTQGGKTATEAITSPFRLLGEGATKAGEVTSDLTGSPALGAAVDTGIQALPMLLGAKAAPNGTPAILPASVERVLTSPGAVVNKAASAVYRTIEPRLPGGVEDIVSRRQGQLAGDAKAQIVNALLSAQELVPGSKPTAGEAIASMPEATQLAAHQKVISREEGAAPLFAAREAQQEGARSAALSSVAQTPEALATAGNVRSANAAQNYGSVAGQIVKPDDALQSLLSRPSMQVAIQDAKQGAAETGGYFPEKPSDGFSIANLQRMKQSLDDAIKDPASLGIKATEAKEIATTREKFVRWLSEKSPDWAKARAQYASDSQPINQMQVGQYLQQKLSSPLNPDLERSATFAQAVRDAPGTIKRSTGAPMYDELSQVLSPEQNSVVQAILGDLSRKSQFEASARRMSPSTSEGRPIELPQLLSRPMMEANFVMKMLHGGKEAAINEAAAKTYLNPEALANSLTRKTTQEMIAEAILRARNPLLVAGGIAGAERAP